MSARDKDLYLGAFIGAGRKPAIGVGRQAQLVARKLFRTTAFDNIISPRLVAAAVKRYVFQIELVERMLFLRLGALTIFPLNFEDCDVWHAARRR
ncbi:hypothetical protein CK224_22990 [Mesorhizobium sp. WSM3862]|nr:hypothetical protein CK224_22990 [Mesorhizobium sp. WSM3862]